MLLRMAQHVVSKILLSHYNECYWLLTMTNSPMLYFHLTLIIYPGNVLRVNTLYFQIQYIDI